MQDIAEEHLQLPEGASSKPSELKLGGSIVDHADAGCNAHRLQKSAANCRRRRRSPPRLSCTPFPRPRPRRAGEKVALDHLGPLIVNPDGSLRRIANWQSLSEGERTVALRRVAKRNAERLAKLEEQQQQQQQQGQGRNQEL